MCKMYLKQLFMALFMMQSYASAFHLQRFKNVALHLCESANYMEMLCNSMPINENHYIPCKTDENCGVNKFCLNNACERGTPVRLRATEQKNKEYIDDPIYTYNQESYQESNRDSDQFELNPFLTTIIKETDLDKRQSRHP